MSSSERKICVSACRDNIIAVIDSGNFSTINNEYLIEMIKNNATRGNVDWGTMVICSQICCFMPRSTKYLMKKLNNTMFIKLTEDSNA